MRVLIMGGDARFLRLGELLERDGHRVFHIAMEKALPVQGPPDYEGSEAVILPLPAEKAGLLNSPLSEGRHNVKTLLAPLRPGTKVFAGMVGEELGEYCRERGLVLHDYFKREDFQVKNALLTAEGALGLLLGLDGRGLMGRRALIVGFGRIGRLLAPRLQALGLAVSVMARSASQRAWAEAMGCTPMKIGEKAAGFDFVLNTVPAALFGEKELGEMGGAALIELASAPGGFDEEAAEKLAKNIVKAPGLPSGWAEISAAEALRDTIYNIADGLEE